MSSTNALIVMAKRPAAGYTKTRLCPPLTPSSAASLYACFLQDTVDLMRQVPGVRPVIAYMPEAEQAYFRKLAPGLELVLQQGATLGERLDNVITDYLNAGYQRVVAIGSDSPTLPVNFLHEAFVLLSENDVVIGPCEDGGYYLIGFNQPAPSLLREVRMSTRHVMNDTLSIAAKAGLKVDRLPAWYDVDDALMLQRLAQELETAPKEVAPQTRRFLMSLDESAVKRG